MGEGLHSLRRHKFVASFVLVLGPFRQVLGPSGAPYREKLATQLTTEMTPLDLLRGGRTLRASIQVSS